MRKKLRKSFFCLLSTIIICLWLFSCDEHICKIYSNRSFEDIRSIAYNTKEAFFYSSNNTLETTPEWNLPRLYKKLL